jgi:hypothetical protein
MFQFVGGNNVFDLNTVQGVGVSNILADSGGPVNTYALLPGSPAIDAGSYELHPYATVGANQRATRNQAKSIPFTVGDAAITGRDAITGVTATPSDQSLVPDSALSVSGSGASPVLTIAACPNFGTATIAITVTTANGATATTSFSLLIAEAQLLVVTTLNELSTDTDDLTSLREALRFANSLSTAAVPEVTFAADVRGTITLQNTPQPELLTRAVRVMGPGAGLLTIDANRAQRNRLSFALLFALSSVEATLTQPATAAASSFRTTRLHWWAARLSRPTARSPAPMRAAPSPVAASTSSETRQRRPAWRRRMFKTWTPGCFPSPTTAARRRPSRCSPATRPSTWRRAWRESRSISAGEREWESLRAPTPTPEPSSANPRALRSPPRPAPTSPRLTLKDGSPVLFVDPVNVALSSETGGINRVVLTLLNAVDLDDEVLSADTSGTTLTFTQGAPGSVPGTRVFELKGAGALAQFVQVLRTVRYHNASQNPAGSNRRLESVAVEAPAGPTSLVRATVIAVVPVNDAPVAQAQNTATDEDTPKNITP